MAETRPVLEKIKESQVLRKTFVFGVASAALTGAIYNGIGAASADTTVMRVGGNGDSDAGIPVSVAQQNGTYNPNVNNIEAHYSATVMPMDKSVREGAAQVVNAYYSHGGGDFTCDGFSLGAIVCDAAGDQIMADHGGQVPGDFHEVTEGNADAQSGAFQSPFARMAEPFVGPIMDVNMNYKPVPGTVNRFNVGDVWGNGNQGVNFAAGIDQLVHLDQHWIPNPNDPHETYVGPDGVINEVYGQGAMDPVVGPSNPAHNPFLNPGGVPRDLSSVSVLLNPEFPGEAPCIAEDGSQYFTPGDAPCGDVPSAAPRGSSHVAAPAEVSTPAPAPVEAPAPAPERSSTPEFWGEAPCIAEDGSQYFTPGDAPC